MSEHHHDCCSHVQPLALQDLCACGSGLSFESCCEPFLSHKQLPKTPLQLMRSRYTAYTQALIDYVAETMCGKAAQGFNVEAVAHWAHHVVWQRLEIIRASSEGDEGLVEFKAFYEEQGKPCMIHETSQFRYLQGRWFYMDSVKTQKLGRNDPCHCGSGKKYKKCCL